MGVPNSNPTYLSVVTGEFGGGGSLRAAAANAGLSAPDGLAEFKGMSATTDISKTNYVRLSSSGNSTYSTRDVTSAIVFLSVMLDMRLRRQDNYVYYEVREQASAPISLYYPVGGGSSSLSTSYVTMGRFNLGGITAIKMNWSKSSSPSGSSGSIAGSTAVSATYAASDNSWQSISNGQSIGARMQAFATAECYQTETATCTVTIDVSARKSGYNDTTLGTYKHECRAVAESNNCF